MSLFRATAQLAVKGMSRNLFDEIRLFCTVAIFVAAVSQVTLNLAEPKVFVVATIFGVVAVILPGVLRAIWQFENRSS